MHIIDGQDRSGFELVDAKKKKYLFKTANSQKRDEWAEALKKYTEISYQKSNLPDLISSSEKNKERQQMQTEQHSLSSLEDENGDDQEINQVAFTEIGENQKNL